MQSDPQFELERACKEGLPRIARKAIAAGAHIDSSRSNLSGDFPIQRAIRHKRDSVVRVLIDAGAEVGSVPGQGHEPPLAVAIQVQSLSMVRLLLAAGASPSIPYRRDTFFDQMTPGMEALFAEPSEGRETWLLIFAALLDAGADVDTPFQTHREDAPTARIVAVKDFPEAFALIERHALMDPARPEAGRELAVKPAFEGAI